MIECLRTTQDMALDLNMLMIYEERINKLIYNFKLSMEQKCRLVFFTSI